jgi:hypothetical protein
VFTETLVTRGRGGGLSMSAMKEVCDSSGLGGEGCAEDAHVAG